MAFGKFGRYYPDGDQLRPECCDALALIRKEIETLRTAQADGPRLTFESDRPSCRLTTDVMHLRFVVVNLVQNALKYSPADSTVTVRCRQGEGGLEIEVADTGIGIPADEIDALFSPFYRASNAAMRPGTGMGLAIAKKSAALIRAAIEVDSTEGEGTRFTVRLPC